MKRWNGWGIDSVEYVVHKPAKSFIQNKVGRFEKGVSLRLENILENVSKSRIKKKISGFNTNIFERFVHSYGQGFPDWLKFKMGLAFRPVDAVAFPENENEIEEIIRVSVKEGFVVIPYGGGTSVVGHLDVVSDKPAVSLDLSRLNRVLSLDEVSNIAEIEAGASGPQIETQLNSKGYTLGHFPQSFELSTLGGWIATKSAGQFSSKYGKIEDMLLGCTLISPEDKFMVKPFVKSATGMDLREVVLGSEGRIGVIYKAFMKVHRLPESEVVEAAFLENDEVGIEVVKQLSNSGIPFTMLRLSLSKETDAMLSLISHKWWYKLLDGYVRIKRFSDSKCMLLFAASGNKDQVKLSLGFARNLVKKFGGINLGEFPGKAWLKDRFKTPYLRNTLWDMGFGVDTLETSTVWSNVLNLVNQIESILKDTLVFSHLSHTYPSGSSIYTTFVFGLSNDPEENYFKWYKLKSAVSDVIVKNGGVISHHHGVGLYHKRYLVEEKGKKGISVMRSVIKEFDPYNIMNPGKLVD